MTKAERKSLWETRVAQYRVSGQSASAWCAENKVSLCQLYYWLKKNGAQPVWIPVEIQESSGESSLCVRVGRAAILFVFCNRNRDKIKILHWDHNGFWLYSRRLERGKFAWPQSNRVVSITRR